MDKIEFLKQVYLNYESKTEEEKAIFKQHSKRLEEEHIKDLKIKLDSGREVIVESFTLENTYGGVIFCSGGPDDESLNNSIFEKSKATSSWGSNKTLKIRPSEEEFQEGFKPYRFTVSLRSEPLDQQYWQSELVVIWFDYNPDGATIESIIHNGIKSIDWDANAQDFEF